MSAASPKDVASRSPALSARVFEDSDVYIETVRQGLPGSVLRDIMQTLGQSQAFRHLFVTLLETTSGNLHRLYKRSSLPRAESEEILDTLAVLRYAETVFRERDIANEWLRTPVTALAGKCPIELCDTFKGRQLVREALQKIEHGDFS